MNKWQVTNYQTNKSFFVDGRDSAEAAEEALNILGYSISQYLDDDTREGNMLTKSAMSIIESIIAEYSKEEE